MDRAYVNKSEGKAVCCWNAPTRKDIEDLFEKANARYDSITQVEEMQVESF